MVLAKAVVLAMCWAMVVDIVEPVTRAWSNARLPVRGYEQKDKNINEVKL